jgi:hypothetical protein
LLAFRGLYEAGDAVQHIRPLGASAIEIMNYRTLAIVKRRRSDLEMPDGEVHMLLIEYEENYGHDGGTGSLPAPSFRGPCCG